MVYIIGASGLAGLFRKFSYAEKRQYGPKIFAVGDLSFNPEAYNRLKILQNLLRKGPLRGRRDIVIWHGVISNTVSAHSTNNFQPCSTEDLLPILAEFKDRIAAILYLQRTSERINIVRKLFQSKILILDVRRHLISRLKRQNSSVQSNLGQVHPSVRCEKRLFETILRHQNNLKSLLRFRAKTKRLSKERRARLKFKVL